MPLKGSVQVRPFTKLLERTLGRRAPELHRPWTAAELASLRDDLVGAEDWGRTP